MEGIDTIPNTDADNALILGTALHTGIEEGVEQALDFYKNSFPVLTDDHIHEMMKLEAMIPKQRPCCHRAEPLNFQSGTLISSASWIIWFP